MFPIPMIKIIDCTGIAGIKRIYLDQTIDLDLDSDSLCSKTFFVLLVICVFEAKSASDKLR